MSASTPEWHAEFEVDTPERMHAAGVALGRGLRAGDIVGLDGPLGAGKTTLTAGIGEGMNVRGPITSPTFVLARTHPSLVGGTSLVHVDAYRLSSELEFDDLDIDYDDVVTVVEWAEGFIEDVAESRLEITLAARPVDQQNPGDLEVASRSLRVVAFGHRFGREWIDRLAGALDGPGPE